MSAPLLRPYQIDLVAEFDREVAAGKRKILLVAPTAAGKTVIMAAIIAAAVAERKRVLVIAHRREIITLTSRKLHDREVWHGIIRAGDEKKLRPTAAVQVASIQTLHARAVRSTTMRMPLADLLIIDEAHHARAATYREVIDAYPDAILRGLTATPCRGDGLGLGNIFEAMIQCPQVAELITQGYLVRSRVYAPVDPDLSGVRVEKGDYVEAQLAARMDRPKLVGDIITHWHKLGERRRTIAFACSVGHSIHIRDEFIRSGVRAEHLDGSTPRGERDAMLARLASGETEVIANCMVLTEGWDCPEVGCCILARPTRRMGLYRQMIGRGLRPAVGKSDYIILDHSGAAFRHGLPEDHVEWSLDVDHRATAPAHQARLERKVPGLIECVQCSALRLGGKPCPNCGFLPRRPGQYVAHLEGELGLVTGGRANAVPYDPATRARWHGMLTHIARKRGYKVGWAAHKYREKFGSFPTWGVTIEPIEPTPEVLSWVRSRNIAYAKARAMA
jgi:superfamily II DNA or RNA helicase